MRLILFKNIILQKFYKKFKESVKFLFTITWKIFIDKDLREHRKYNVKLMH